MSPGFRFSAAPESVEQLGSRLQLDGVWLSGIVKTNRVSSGVDVTSILPP
jgi:hypothetical protein